MGTTSLAQLKEIGNYMRFKDAASMKASQLVGAITQTLKIHNRFYDNAPEVTDMKGQAIVTKEQMGRKKYERHLALQQQQKQQQQERLMAQASLSTKQQKQEELYRRRKQENAN